MNASHVDERALYDETPKLTLGSDEYIFALQPRPLDALRDGPFRLVHLRGVQMSEPRLEGSDPIRYGLVVEAEMPK